MSPAWAQAFALVFDPYNIFVMLVASVFGLFVGAVPGLTATMATALLVPVTFFMAPIPAIAAIVTATAMAIFSGDIPGCLMRMPGTPASAAYTDEAYAMARKGLADTALGAGLVFSALGGLIGMFAISEIIRFAVDTNPQLQIVDQPIGNVFKRMWHLTKKYPVQILRGNAVGTLIGALPGAGADIAAWITYAISKRFSKEPEKFGTGHVEGIVESGSANNSALAGAWIPALVFGIPGDSITAIVIGVLYMKNMNPGPTLFTNNPQNIYAVYLLFIIANLIMVPLGWWCIKVSKQILKVPRSVLMPVIMLFCVVGAFAINNTPFDVTVMLVAGVAAYFLEANGFPVAPAILGVVLGAMLEENFITSMIKSDGHLSAFFERPIAATLGAMTLAVWFLPLLLRRLRQLAGIGEPA